MVPTWPVAEEETEVATTWEELEAAGDAEQAAHGSDPFPGGWCLPRGKKMTTFSGSFLLPAEAQPVSLSPGSNTCKGPPNQDYNTNQEAQESQALGPAHTAPSPSAPQSDPAAPCSPLHPSLCGSTCNSCAQRPEAPHEASAKVAPGSRLLLLLLLLVGIAAVPGIGAGSQSYWYFYMGVSDPGPDMLDFTAVGYMGDQQILHYNSETQRQEPRGNWVQGAVGLDSWNRETRTLQGWQEVFKWNLLALQHHYKQTSGSHTLQFMYGCQLGEDGCTRRYMQFGYDGGDFISYDLGMRTSVAETTQAQVTQRKWNEDKYRLQYLRAYLEGTCIEWLRQYLQHREAILQSRRPVAQVSDRSLSQDGFATLSCRVHGFYPWDVAVVWLKDGETQPQEMSHLGVLPSGDGTYQTRATIEIDPSSDHDYTCRVEHESLGAALRVAWDKGRAGYDPVMIVGIVISLVLVIAVTGAAGYFCNEGVRNQLQPCPPQLLSGTTQQQESQGLGLDLARTALSPPAPCSDPAASSRRCCGLLHLLLHGSTHNVCAQWLETTHKAAAKVVPGSWLLHLLLFIPGINAGSHSYQHFYMAVSDPSSDVFTFTAVGYVDDQQVLHYDSETQRQEPRGDWVQGAVGPDFWEGESRTLRAWQRGFKRNLRTLRYYYNQTKGSHTLQFTYGCELREDNSTGGHMQLGYDGADFISYDLATRTWVAAPAQAQRTQCKWNEDKPVLQDTRSYLEETCIAWLRQYLRHGEAALQSRRPVAQVSDRPSSRDGRTTLSCRVRGFYPRDVAVVWLKDGEAQPQETSRSGVLPSGDGTYQTRATIEIDPSSDHDYTCRVEHESLGAALRVAWDKGRPGYDPGMTVGVVIGVIVLVIAVTGAAGYFCRPALLSPDHADGPPLDPLNAGHIPPEVRHPELDAVLHLQPDQCRIVGEDHLLGPA